MTEPDSRVNRLTFLVIGCAMSVHSARGPGLLESAYLACLIHELRKAGLQIEIEVKVPIHYDGIDLGCGLRIDLRAPFARVRVPFLCVRRALRGLSTTSSRSAA